MSTNKSLNYVDNQSTPLTTPPRNFTRRHFFIGAISDISNEVKNNNQQPSHSILTRRTTTTKSTRVLMSCQCNFRKSDCNSANKTKNNKINDQPKDAIYQLKDNVLLDIQHRRKNVLLLFTVADTYSPSIIGLNSNN